MKIKKNINLNWPYISNHPYRNLITGCSGSGKTNGLLNLIKNESDIHKIFLYAKDPFESKYQSLINKHERESLKNYDDDPKAFIKYSNYLQDIDKNIESCNLRKKRKISMLFDDMIADISKNKELNPVVTELFIGGKKLNISVVFITQSHFKVPKEVLLNATQFFIMKIPNKRELQEITLN